jgi:hypothetical protein
MIGSASDAEVMMVAVRVERAGIHELPLEFHRRADGVDARR